MNLIFERWKRQQDRPLSVRAKQMNWLQPYLSSISAENTVCTQLISYYFPYYLVWQWLRVHVACYMENDAMSTLDFVVMTKRGKEGTCPLPFSCLIPQKFLTLPNLPLLRRSLVAGSFPAKSCLQNLPTITLMGWKPFDYLLTPNRTKKVFADVILKPLLSLV